MTTPNLPCTNCVVLRCVTNSATSVISYNTTFAREKRFYISYLLFSGKGLPYTVRVRLRVRLDTPLFLGLCGWILKPHDLMIGGVKKYPKCVDLPYRYCGQREGGQKVLNSCGCHIWKPTTLVGETQFWMASGRFPLAPLEVC